MSGTRKLPKRRGDRRDQEEEHHDDPVHREQLVVGVVREHAFRRQQVQAHTDGERAADEEERRDGEQIQQRDALVIGGEQPRLPSVIGIQIIGACFGLSEREVRCSFVLAFGDGAAVAGSGTEGERLLI